MDKNLARIRHERSKKDFPKLELDDDEYVEFAFGRAKNSLLLQWAKIGGGIAIVLLALLLLLVSELVDDDTGLGFFLIIIVVLALVGVVSGIGVSAVHYGNKLYFTNKRMIQVVVNFPLLETVRSVNLEGIHKVDYEQTTIIERLLHYGTFKVSTHEKNVMVLENQSMKSAMDVFKDNTGSVYVFKDVEMSGKEIDEINELIQNAPKMGHKSTEEKMSFNSGIREEIDEG